MGERQLESIQAMKALEGRLAKCPTVAQYGKDEATSLAYNFAELERSMSEFLHEQVPKLADPGVEGRKLEDLLMDIQVDLQHILYHIHDPQFFRVVEPTHDWLALSEGTKNHGEGEG